jgi:hypothetical protein
MPLEEELKYFNSIRDELIKNHDGKFALVMGQVLAGTFDRAEDAYGEGVRLYGTKPFLVKQILREEPTETIPALTVGLMDARL